MIPRPARRAPTLADVGGYYRIVTGVGVDPAVLEEFQMPGDTYQSCDDAWGYLLHSYSHVTDARLQRWYDPTWVNINWRTAK